MSRTFVFDTWAWVEVLRGSDAGTVIAELYLSDPARQVWTPDIALVEAAAAMHKDGLAPEDVASGVEDIVARSDAILVPDAKDAVLAPYLRAALRKSRPSASLADALILAMARNRKARVVSCDEAFAGEPDVVCVREKPATRSAPSRRSR